MGKDGRKSKNNEVARKDLELISKLSKICNEYNYTILEALIKLKEIKGKEVR